MLESPSSTCYNDNNKDLCDAYVLIQNAYMHPKYLRIRVKAVQHKSNQADALCIVSFIDP